MSQEETEVLIDCDNCQVRGAACGDCVVSVLLGAPPGEVEIDPIEQQALDALAAGGLVPRLQLVLPDEAGGALPDQAAS